MYYPDLFIINTKLDIDKGVFFIIIAKGQNSISENAIKIYKRYFPPNIIITYKDMNNHYQAKWLNSIKDYCDLEDFLKIEVGIDENKSNRRTKKSN